MSLVSFKPLHCALLCACYHSTCSIRNGPSSLITSLSFFFHAHCCNNSFDYGGVHFVSLDTETDFPDAAENEKGDSGIFDAGHFAPDGESRNRLRTRKCAL